MKYEDYRCVKGAELDALAELMKVKRLDGEEDDALLRRCIVRFHEIKAERIKEITEQRDQES